MVTRIVRCILSRRMAVRLPPPESALVASTGYNTRHSNERTLLKPC
jgi:hypothetical protein